MTKFIEVHNNIINIESISKIEFVSDDIYLGDFPKGQKGEIIIDYLPFIFAKVELFSGETIELQLDLYQPEQNETEEYWSKRNRVYINVSWTKLIESLGDITRVTGYEYVLD